MSIKYKLPTLYSNNYYNKHRYSICIDNILGDPEVIVILCICIGKVAYRSVYKTASHVTVKYMQSRDGAAPLAAGCYNIL